MLCIAIKIDYISQMQLNPQTQLIKHVIQRIERCMSYYYGFTLQMSAADYLVSRETILRMVDDAEHYPEWQALAAVWFDMRGDEMYVALHCDSTIIAALTEQDPCERLHNGNLTDFCVLVEEVSHFHLLTNKAAQQADLSRLELELQAEIDKVIVSADFIYRQTGACHLVPLVKIICRDVAGLGSLYRQASLWAWHFFCCFMAAESVHTYSASLQELLRHCYLFPWQQKRPLLFDPLFI